MRILQNANKTVKDKEMKIEIYDLIHKPYRVPTDPLYIPIQPGCAEPGCKYLGDGIQRDDEGDNISIKNRAYNMLCPMYWVWKHSQADYVGIVHYRRFLVYKKKSRDGWSNILNSKEAEELCSKHSIIFPKKSIYPFFTLRTHYINTFKELKKTHTLDLDTMREVIKDLFPEYLDAHDKVMNQSWGHQGNIYIMQKNLYDEHCEFMFKVLDECEKRLAGKRHDYNRYIASLAEFLPDIWVEKNGYDYIELNLFMPEEPPFLKRLINLFNRMYRGKRDPHRFNANSYYSDNAITEKKE